MPQGYLAETCILQSESSSEKSPARKQDLTTRADGAELVSRAVRLAKLLVQGCISYLLIHLHDGLGILCWHVHNAPHLQGGLVVPKGLLAIIVAVAPLQRRLLAHSFG